MMQEMILYLIRKISNFITQLICKFNNFFTIGLLSLTLYMKKTGKIFHTAVRKFKKF